MFNYMYILLITCMANHRVRVLGWRIKSLFSREAFLRRSRQPLKSAKYTLVIRAPVCAYGFLFTIF